MNQENLIFCTILFCSVTGLLNQRRTYEKNNRMALRVIQGKLDALLKNAGIEYQPYADVSPTVLEAIQNNQPLKAIKAYREATGFGLKEAKEHVAEIIRNQENRRR